MMSVPTISGQSEIRTARSWSLGTLTLSYGPQARSLPPPQGAELLIPTLQPLTLHQDKVQRILRPPLDLLYLPADAHPLQTSPYHGWRLVLDPVGLCQLAAELSGHRLSPARFRRRLQTAHPVMPRSTPGREYSEALLQLLRMVQSQPGSGDNPLEQVGLDQAIQRLIVLLVCGDLIQASRGRKEPERGGKHQIFDELLLWIHANLHRSIQLRDLVEHSGYSQRSLRNFFQERFSCGPIHWIRSRRLEAARERLLCPEQQDTVSSIAAAFGYPHLSQFSRDFQTAYQTRPSDLLREGFRSMMSE